MGQQPTQNKSSAPLFLVAGLFLALVASPNIYTWWKWKARRRRDPSSEPGP